MLELLLSDRRLGAASKLAYLFLWEFSGHKPGQIIITADWLGSQCGRSPKAAWLWLDELAKHDLLEIVDRNERRGTIAVNLYAPAPGQRELAANSARSLFEGQEGEGSTPHHDSSGVGTMVPTSTRTPVSEVSTPKPPRPLVPKKQENISSQSTNVSKESRHQSAIEPKSVGNPTKEAARFDPAAIVATVDRFDPAEQKARLKARIIAACGRETPCAEWVAGSLAGLVAYHGVPIEDVNAILGDLDAMRSVGSLRHAGRFIHAKGRELAARLGKPWPRREAVGV